MKMTITREEAIEAMRTEPLKAGAWFHENSFSSTNSTKSGCAVCAVGSIIDKKIGHRYRNGFQSLNDMSGMIGAMIKIAHLDGLCEIKDFETNDYFSEEKAEKKYKNTRKDIKKILGLAKSTAKKGYYLSALSSLFEELSLKRKYKTSAGYANGKLRKILISFIEKNFPEKFTLDTDKKY